MKSLGSDVALRAPAATCDLTVKPTPICNPDSQGVDKNQAWDVGTTWLQTGVLDKMGWRGATTGMGLNELGAAIGKASIVYEQMTKRVIREVCPMGAFTAEDVSRIAASADPNAQPAGSDDVRTIVAKVAAHESCQ